MLSKATKLDYNTVKRVVQHLQEENMMTKGRKVGNAQTYRFSVENDLHLLLSWAAEFQHGKRKLR